MAIPRIPCQKAIIADKLMIIAFVFGAMCEYSHGYGSSAGGKLRALFIGWIDRHSVSQWLV
jgi:hypothetical protein